MRPELQTPCVVPATCTQAHCPLGEQVKSSKLLLHLKKFEHMPTRAEAVAVAVVVVVVLVATVTEMTSVIKAVSVTCTVVTGGVIVLLALASGVATVVLRTVSVLVTEVVPEVCKQEHTRAMSEAGRDKTLEKMLA
jgi:hypothetical protein